MEGLGPSTQKTKTRGRRRNFVAKIPQNKRSPVHFGHQSISTTTPNNIYRPIRPTRPVNHPTSPSTLRGLGGPSLPPPLGPIGTRPDGTQGPGPPSGPLFSVFCFPGSLAGSLGLGLPLTERLKTHRPDGETANWAEKLLIGRSNPSLDWTGGNPRPGGETPSPPHRALEYKACTREQS